MSEGLAILWVGGPRDGLREPLPPQCGNMAKCVDRKRTQNTPYDGGFTIEEHIYTMHRLQDGDGKAHCIMAHQTIDCPIAALIKGYHRHRKPDRHPRMIRPRRPRGPLMPCFVPSNP